MNQDSLKNLRNSDILHCWRNSFLSRAIRFITRSKRTSHTALFITVNGEPFIIDSQWDGTRLRSFEEWNKKYNYNVIVTRGLYLTPKELIRGVRPYINTAYGYWDMFKHLVYNYTGWWIKGKREEQFLTCSEFVSRLLKKPDAYKTNPAELYLWLLENDYENFKP